MLHGHDDARHRARMAQRRWQLPAHERQIVLVRHGATVGELHEKLAHGDLVHSNPALTHDGHVQAEAVGKALENENIAHVFVTPLTRTHQTAAPLCARLEREPLVEPGLRESHLGDFEHDFYAQAEGGNPVIARVFAEQRWDVIPNAEPAGEIERRVRAGIGAIATMLLPGQTGVAFSHAGTIAEICRLAVGGEPFAFLNVQNGSITRLLIGADGRWKLHSFNEVAHLA
jgi:probable phosphoglycerate mutase